jgi:hypothetical protein
MAIICYAITVAMVMMLKDAFDCYMLFCANNALTYKVITHR